MDRWTGRVALVTGASAGIGAAIVKDLVLKGMKVIGVARRVERIEEMKMQLKNAPGVLFPVKCDLQKESDILETFQWAEKTLGGVDVLVNNAGVVHDSYLADGDTQKWRQILDVNIMGLSICTREAIKSMRARGVDDGHIIHINSIAGHTVAGLPGFAMYSASKFAVTALTEGLRAELAALKTNIKITSLSPGAVRTEIMDHATVDANVDLYNKYPCLEPEDISEGVIYVLSTGPKVQCHELTLKPLGEYQ